ncbi:MAG: enoyl-CoA hydratase/isomerase family protein, partial [Candidatus Binatia bacterium]
MTNFETILFEKQRRGVLITLNRPALRNALNRKMKDELRAALELARDDEAIRAVVLTGAGGLFSSGDDMNESLVGKPVWPYGIAEGSALGDVYNRLRDRTRQEKIDEQLYRWEFPKPIIAAVSGWCLGAASWLALTCHMVIAADDAVFGQPQVRHGAGTD